MKNKKMNNKFQEKSLFDSDFDSFDLDDGFLLQVNADSKKNLHNKKECSSLRKDNLKDVDKSDLKGKEIRQNIDKTIKCSDLSLLIEDLNESDFFDVSKTEPNCSKEKVRNGHKDNNGKQLSVSSAVKNCLSPVFHKNKLSSSTPLKPKDESDCNEKPEYANHDVKNSQFDYLEADLFDDWDVNDINKISTDNKDTVTFSQALKLIEEAESENQSTPTKDANESIDMLTGEVVTADIHNLLKQSFDLLQPVREESDEQKSSSDSIIVLDAHVGHKPSAAHKLNFDSESKDTSNLDVKRGKEKTFGNACFSSDDEDFHFFTQDLLGKLKKNSKNGGKATQGVPNITNKSADFVDSFDLNHSNAEGKNVKRRRRVNVIESDTAEDSPSPKFRRQRKSKIKNRRIFQESFAREFYDLEAEVEEGVQASSDEVEEEADEYEQSFLDEESYHTQNRSADMTAKYLQSVKGSSRSGKFKIPAVKPYDPEEVLSQALEENIDYQIDSFCVNDVDEETKTEMSDLEVAEIILEIDEKKKKKRFQKTRKIK